MKNPHFYADEPQERVAVPESPCADPEYFRQVGDAFGCTAIYMTKTHTLQQMLRPDYWRKCVTQGLWRGTVIELRMGEPAELRTRRIVVVDINRHTGNVVLALEMRATKDGDMQFKRVSFPDKATEAA